MEENTRKRIISSIYKILPLYEEHLETSYLDYLETMIPIFKGYSTMGLIDIEVLSSIVGLYEMGKEVTHRMVKRIVMRAIHSVNEKGKTINEFKVL